MLTRTIVLLIFFFGLGSNACLGAIVTLPSLTRHSNYNNLGGSVITLNPNISGESDLYLVASMTFNNFRSANFDLIEFKSANNQILWQWGHALNSDQFSWIPYDSSNGAPTGAPQGVQTITSGATITAAARIDQNSGGWELFVNPDFSTSVDMNTAILSGTHTIGGVRDIARVNYRGTTASGNETVAYSGAIYTNGDSPFASTAVPEPGAFGFCVASLVTLSVVRRNRLAAGRH